MNPTTHVQPGGEVVMSVELSDGRVLRICGAREYRGCDVARELDKTLRWMARPQ